MPRDIVRFAVVDGPLALSSVWVVWRNKRDVYVAIRTIAFKFKTSLHESGQFRHAYVSDAEAERFQRKGCDRAIAKWRRPPEQVPGGTLVFQVLIPGCELGGKILKYPLPNKLVPLNRPSETEVAYVSIIETGPEAVTNGPQMAEGTTTRLAKWNTEEGGSIWVVSHSGSLSDGNRAYIAHYHELARAVVRGGERAAIHEQPGDDPSELRAVVTMRPSAGVGQIIDLNLEFLRREFFADPQ
jgi:hypothetical protein